MSTFQVTIIAGIAEDDDRDVYRMARPLASVTLDECDEFAHQALRGAMSHVEPAEVKPEMPLPPAELE